MNFIYKSKKKIKPQKSNENTKDWSLIKDHAAFDKEVQTIYFIL